MSQKELSSSKGLVIANTVLVVNGSSVGVGTATPSYSLHIATTDAAKLPVGNNAQRPANSVGLIRYNTDQSDFELVRVSGNWETFNSIISNTSSAEAAIASRSSNTQILFNDSTEIAGSAGLIFNKTSNNLTVSNAVLASMVNGATISVGSSFVANGSGVYHSGVVNGATISVGSSFVANGSGVYHSGLSNAAQFVIPNAMLANSQGLYHNGILTGNSLSVSNSSAQILFANATVFSYISNASFTGSLFTLGTWLSVNSSILNYSTGQINAAIGVFGGSIVANSSRFVIGTSIGLQANGTIGTNGQTLKSNGTTVYWGSDFIGVNQVSTGNGLTGGPITDTGSISVLANSGIVSNSTGTFVNAGTGIVANSTGVHVNSSYIATISANNASFLGGTAAANYTKNNEITYLPYQWNWTVSGGPCIIGTSNTDYGILGITGSSGYGGVRGVSASGSQYGILGFQNQYALYGAGDIYTTGSAYIVGNIAAYYSDKRLKDDVTPIDNPLDKLMQIGGYYYRNNDLAKSVGYTDEKVQIGVLAQEVEKVIPQAITLAPFDTGIKDNVKYSKSGENYLTVQHDKLIPLLIESNKALYNMIKELEKKINDITNSK